MQITFTKLRYKNILSAGNVWTEIDLKRSPSTIITGKNGGGKSTAFEALTIAITGQSIRKLTKAKLVNNKTKKDALMEVYFTTADGRDCIIRRGIKPDLLEVHVNGIMVNQEASVKQMQQYIYRDLLKTDRISWQITHMISKSGIQMFMSLKTEERRQFIDNMLGTQVFTVMAKGHRIEVDKTSKENDRLAAEVKRLDGAVDGKREEIDTYLMTFEQFNDAQKLARADLLQMLGERIEQARQNLQDEQESDDGIEALGHRENALLQALEAAQQDGPDNEALYKRAKELDFQSDMIRSEIEHPDGDAWEAAKKRLKELAEARSEVSGDIRAFKAQLKRLQAGVCDHCGMEATPEHVEAERNRILDDLEPAEEAYEALGSRYEKVSAKLDAFEAQKDAATAKLREAEKLESEVKNVERQIVQAQADYDKMVKRAEQDLDDVRAQIESAAGRKAKRVESANAKLLEAMAAHEEKKAEPIQFKDPQTDSRLAELDADLEKLVAEFEESCENRDTIASTLEYLNVISAMLKEGGVKTTIVRKFMPQVNRIVNESMHRLGMNAKFTMDENFDESIIWNGQEYEFNQLSEGERLRVNVSLLMAWREIARMQSRLSSNVLFFDEVMGESLDEDGFAAMEDIFERSFGGLNVFMITHSPEKVSGFMRSGITFEKHKGFSRIVPSE